MELKKELMGILNITPNSFFEKGAHYPYTQAVEHGIRLWKQGANIIDIGGAPSHPGAPKIEEEEEIRRVLPVLLALKDQLPIPISIDTSSPKVALVCAQNGVRILNDVRGFIHPKMREIAGEHNLQVCIVHHDTLGQGGISLMMEFFDRQINLLTKAGVKKEHIILDPGIGFGKTWEGYPAIARCKELGFRVLVGASRKKHLGQAVQKKTEDLLAATLTAHTLSLILGADILRVHDVAEHRDMLSIASHFSDTIFSHCRESFSHIQNGEKAGCILQ